MVGVFFKILGVHAQQGAVVFLIIRKFGNDAAGLIPQAARHGNVPFLDEPFDQPSPLDAAQRRDKDAGPGIRGSDGNDGEFQRCLLYTSAILDDPEASDNDKSVALTMLRNAEVASAGILPFCQDTGTATIVGKKGQQVWTGCDDCEQLSHGVYDAYTQNNLRYSQTVALDMYTEKNTGTNLPAQIDLEAVEGMKYSFPVSYTHLELELTRVEWE